MKIDIERIFREVILMMSYMSFVCSCYLLGQSYIANTGCDFVVKMLPYLKEVYFKSVVLVLPNVISLLINMFIIIFFYFYYSPIDFEVPKDHWYNKVRNVWNKCKKWVFLCFSIFLIIVGLIFIISVGAYASYVGISQPYTAPMSFNNNKQSSFIFLNDHASLERCSYCFLTPSTPSNYLTDLNNYHNNYGTCRAYCFAFSKYIEKSIEETPSITIDSIIKTFNSPFTSHSLENDFFKELSIDIYGFIGPYLKIDVIISFHYFFAGLFMLAVFIYEYYTGKPLSNNSQIAPSTYVENIDKTTRIEEKTTQVVVETEQGKDNDSIKSNSFLRRCIPRRVETGNSQNIPNSRPSEISQNRTSRPSPRPQHQNPLTDGNKSANNDTINVPSSGRIEH